MWNWYTNNNPVRKLKNKVEEQKMKTKNKSFKRLFAFLVALVMVTALVPSVIFAADPTFPDVPTTHWAYDYIEKLAKAEIIGGYADGTFGPEDNVTRQQAAKMIAGAADLEAGINFTSKFTDLDKVAAELKPFVLALEENKVAGGFADGSFGPTLNIKRSQAAKMIVKAFGIVKGGTAVSFADPVADATDQSYIDILASNGIVKGYTEDGKQLFKPYNLVTRAQLAKMIVEAMEWEPELVSVKAMDQTVAQRTTAPTTAELKFLVNGQVYTATSFEEVFGNEYTLTFSYSAAAPGTSAEKAEGKVNVTALVEFKYAVQVTDDLGKKIPATITSADYADVEIVAPTAPVKVTEYGLYDSAYIVSLTGDAKVDTSEKLDFVAYGDTNAVIVATKGLNGLGQEIDLKAYPEAVTSSKVSVAHYTTGVVTNAVGTTTFEIKWTGILEKNQLVVEVKAARVASAIDNANLKVQWDATGNGTFTIAATYIDLLDQYEAEFDYADLASGEALVLRMRNPLGATVTPAGNAYALETKGVYTVTVSVYKDSVFARNLGSFTIEAVDLTNVTKVDYELKFALPTATELDANPLPSNTKKTLNLVIKAYKAGVPQTDPSISPTLVAETSDVKIATISGLTVTAVGPGTATITLYTVDGSVKTAVATISVLVKNSTPQILTLKATAANGKVTGTDVAATLAGDLASPDLPATVPFAADMIEGVVYSASDKTVVITLKALYGGKVFTYPTN